MQEFLRAIRISFTNKLSYSNQKGRRQLDHFTSVEGGWQWADQRALLAAPVSIFSLRTATQFEDLAHFFSTLPLLWNMSGESRAKSIF
jgi:hypothetical protein